MFKIKTEQKWNDEKCNQTGLTVKIHTKNDGVRATAIMLRSIAASLSWRSPVIEVKQASHRPPFQWKIRPFSDILSNALRGRPHQSLQPSFTALSSRAIFMFRWIRLSFIQKTLALNSLFSTLSCEKTHVFLWAIIRLKFTEHFTSRFCIRDLKTSGKSVKFDLLNYFSL